MKKALFWSLYIPIAIIIISTAWIMYPLCLFYGTDKVADLHENLFIDPAERFGDWAHGYKY